MSFFAQAVSISVPDSLKESGKSGYRTNMFEHNLQAAVPHLAASVAVVDAADYCNLPYFTRTVQHASVFNSLKNPEKN